MRSSNLRKKIYEQRRTSLIKSLDLAGWANSVNDGETERSQVEEMIHKYLTTSGIRYQGKSEMERMEQEIKRWFESQLF